VIASPLRPRQRQEPGIAAAGRLAHQATPYGASLSFATTTHLWPLSDPPSRKLRSATSRTETARSIPSRALASSVSGSPCQGPGTGLPPPISTSVPGTLAPQALALRARPSRRQPRHALRPGDQSTSTPTTTQRPVGPLQAIAPGPVQAIVLKPHRYSVGGTVWAFCQGTRRVIRHRSDDSTEVAQHPKAIDRSPAPERGRCSESPSYYQSLPLHVRSGVPHSQPDEAN
jgi:hypothetical protein